MNIFFIYQRYIDENNNRIFIGGLQTYVENLYRIAKKMGYIVTILQFSSFEFEKTIDGIKVIGVKKKKARFAFIKLEVFVLVPQ